jgi:ferredoxin-thioredoxin reductase catalytic subunit
MGADEKDRQDARSAPALSAVLLKGLAREKQCFAGRICPARRLA